MAKQKYAEDGFPDDFGDEKAAFNMGLATLKTLRELMDEAHRAAIADEPIKYYKHLQRIYMEISSGFKDKILPENIKQLLKFLNDDYSKLISMQTKNQAYMILSNVFYNNLVKWEIWLREQINNQGMGMPSKDDAEFLDI